jgi:hypothetical protein
LNANQCRGDAYCFFIFLFVTKMQDQFDSCSLDS